MPAQPSLPGRPHRFAPTFVLLAVLAFTVPAITAAQPVATLDVLISTDGGTTFTDTESVADMESFLLRLVYDNTGDAPGTVASLTTTLPVGFALVPGSTRVCIEPSPGEIVCNTDVGQGGALAEGTLWSGQTLTVSPTAGLFAESVAQTTGLLEAGKVRFLNLQECHYFNGAERFFVSADPDIVGTNVGNTSDAAAACAGTVGAYGLAGAELRVVDLAAHRYLNLHECHFNFFTDHIIKTTGGTGTTASNTAESTANCAGTSGAHILHPDSFVTALDLFGRRYLNLWECRFISGGDLISINAAYGTGSNTSASPDAAPSCQPTEGAYTLNDSDHLALDLLDTTRGGGFVEIEVVATGSGPIALDATLDAAEITAEMDSATLTVIPSVAPEPMPAIDVQYAPLCGGAFGDMPMPTSGEIFIERIVFDNTGNLAGADASITTTLPPGLSLVPGTTRVCLEPTDGEVVCNDDPGQGGAIDEAAVWSGTTLNISPTAGLFANPVDAASGLLEIGRKRYLNLHECHYFNGLDDRLFLNVDDGAVGTNVANTADAGAVCAPASHGRTLFGASTSSHDLLGGRFLNLQECQYHFFFVDRIFLNDPIYGATNISNAAAGGVGCVPNAGAHSLLPAESTVSTLDLAGQRWLNLHECVLANNNDQVSINTTATTGTNVSATVEDTTAACPYMSGVHHLVDGSVAALDLLDPTRGRGYVEFQVMAGVTIVDLVETVEMSGSNFATVTDTGDLPATANQLFKDGFECGLDPWMQVVGEAPAP